jgi:hypothetical protein
MRQRIIHYLRAGYAGLYLVSPEEQRIEAEFKAIAEELGFGLHVWSATSGLLDVTSKSIRDCNDPLAVLLAITELPDKAIVLLRDFHAFLAGDPNPILVRQLKEVLQAAKTKNKALVLVGCRLCLPSELERELTVIEFALPGNDDLARVLDGVLESARQDCIALPTLEPEQQEALLGAASGLTTIEA